MTIGMPSGQRFPNSNTQNFINQPKTHQTTKPTKKKNPKFLSATSARAFISGKVQEKDYWIGSRNLEIIQTKSNNNPSTKTPKTS